jgi:hypothetical protein
MESAMPVSRKVLGCLAIGAVFVAGTASLASGGPKTVKISGSVVFETKVFPAGGCSTGAAVLVPIVEGATNYDVTVLDNGEEATYGLPPFEDEGAPAGYHRRGLAGLTSSGGDCSDAEQGYRNRFQYVSATATVPQPPIRGRVTDDRGKPVPGVFIHAEGTDGAKTSLDGDYFLQVEPGEYTLRPMGRDVRKFKPPKRVVTVPEGGSVRANFKAETSCERPDQGPPPPKSGFYVDNDEHPLTSAFYFYCRTGRLKLDTVFHPACLDFEETLPDIEAHLRGFAEPRGGGRYGFRFRGHDENYLAPVEISGEFTTRTRVEYRVVVPSDTGCPYARRYHASLKDELTEQQIADLETPAKR